MEAAKTFLLYDDLLTLPERLTGEILNGQLYTQPRPSGPHALVESRLGADLEGPFGRGRGGPGGWWILIEPEIHFIRDTEVAVPDIAGWKREKMPTIPQDHRFKVVPDWICEILSPSTASKDREIKMPLYARYGVSYLWMVDPTAKTLESFQLENGNWLKTADFAADDKVCIPPFEAITICLNDLWC